MSNMRTELTLYYDGKCPFCSAEMRRLAGWDRVNRLDFVDMSQAGFDPSHLQLTMDDLNREMVSQRADGAVLIGVQSLLAAYTLVGKGWLVWPLRVPLLRDMLSWMYRLFARNRYKMSRLLGYKAPACDGATCSVGNPFMKGRK